MNFQHAEIYNNNLNLGAATEIFGADIPLLYPASLWRFHSIYDQSSQIQALYAYQIELITPALLQIPQVSAKIWLSSANRPVLAAKNKLTAGWG